MHVLVDVGPSVEAKYFCSLTRNSVELTKLAPASIAAALTPISRSALSLIGTGHRVLASGVVHATSPTPGVGASSTGSVCALELALAIATAWRAARPRLARRHVVGGAEAPGAVRDHAHADAGRFGVDDVLDLRSRA